MLSPPPGAMHEDAYGVPDAVLHDIDDGTWRGRTSFSCSPRDFRLPVAMAVDEGVHHHRRSSSRRATVQSKIKTQTKLQEAEERRASVRARPVRKRAKFLTQDALISEALETEEENIQSLHRFLAQEEERKARQRASGKKGIEGPFLRWVSVGLSQSVFTIRAQQKEAEARAAAAARAEQAERERVQAEKEQAEREAAQAQAEREAAASGEIVPKTEEAGVPGEATSGAAGAPAASAETAPGAAVPGAAAAAETATPEAAGTGATAPEVAAPATTVPEAAAPATTVPEAAAPAVTAPAAAAPVAAAPAATAPAATAPVATAPQTSAPSAPSDTASSAPAPVPEPPAPAQSTVGPPQAEAPTKGLAGPSEAKASTSPASTPAPQAETVSGTPASPRSASPMPSTGPAETSAGAHDPSDAAATGAAAPDTSSVPAEPLDYDVTARTLLSLCNLAPNTTWPEEFQLLLGDHCEWDRLPVVPSRNRPFRPRQSTCVITGLPARYRDPVTGVAYATKEAFHTLRRVLHNEYRWTGSETRTLPMSAGCYVARMDDAGAAGVFAEAQRRA